ncbi:MAG: hypothetical protein ACRD3M_17605 [Thermoanaerobaculia bacterium]
MRVEISIVVWLLLVPTFVTGEGGGKPLPFDDGGWELSGDSRVETYLGRPALRMRTGGALRRGFTFEDGTIDFDLALTTHRTFSFVRLRRSAEGESEEFYFRGHKSELPDAVQYTPVWRGVGNWQLFHGPGYTAAAAFPREQWFAVRIVLKGDRAAVFVGDLRAPRLVVPRLRRDPAAGGIELAGFLPPGSAPGGVFTTNVSNLVARPGEVPFDFPKAPPETALPGVVREWQISPPFAPEKGAIASLPVTAVSAAGWKTVPAEPSGLVVVDRWVARPETEPRPAMLARIVVEAETKGVRRFRLGYSDEVTVFLDGRPLFSGDAHYSFDSPRQEGLIGLSQATIYLPLRRGRNELVLAVADVFGGWGLMGQFEDPAGLTVAAR